ncbi:MAG: putative rane protein [Herbinix sp.]|jgi:hypothetical protein|nr:putative rane protein [Herbinix sp.]
MFKKDCCTNQEVASPGTTVIVDVAKIVKYACVAGVLIVGIIFGTKCYHKMISESFKTGK